MGGGLCVSELVILGGVRLASDREPIEANSRQLKISGDALDSIDWDTIL